MVTQGEKETANGGGPVKEVSEKVVNGYDEAFKEGFKYGQKTAGPLYQPRLYAALAKAQGSYPEIPKTKEVSYKDKNNRQIQYKYAGLADILLAVRKPLSENGLVLIQPFDEKTQILTTVLAHESGEVLTSTIAINTKQPPQALGSQLTYFRRYSAESILGVSGQEDDDGQIAQDASKTGNRNTQQKKKASPPPRDPNSKATEQELKYLYTLGGNKDIAPDLIKQLAGLVYDIASTKELNFQQYNQLLNTIKKQDADAISFKISEILSQKEFSDQDAANNTDGDLSQPFTDEEAP